MVNIRSEICALLESLDCVWLERNGVTWVLTPENMLWRFGRAEDVTGCGLSDDLLAWVHSAVESNRGLEHDPK